VAVGREGVGQREKREGERRGWSAHCVVAGGEGENEREREGGGMRDPERKKRREGGGARERTWEEERETVCESGRGETKYYDMLVAGAARKVTNSHIIQMLNKSQRNGQLFQRVEYWAGVVRKSRIYVYVYMYVYMCMYIYIYIYIYKYMYTYMC